MGNEFDLLMEMTLSGNAGSELKHLIESSRKLEKGLDGVLNAISKLNGSKLKSFANQMDNIQKFEGLKRSMLDISKTLNSVDSNKGFGSLLKDEDIKRLNAYITQLKNAQIDLGTLFTFTKDGKFDRTNFDKLSSVGAIDAIVGRVKTSIAGITDIAKTAGTIGDAEKKLASLTALQSKMQETATKGSGLGVKTYYTKELDTQLGKITSYINGLKTLSSNKDIEGLASLLREINKETATFSEANRKAAKDISQFSSASKELENATSSASKKINDLKVMKSRFSEMLSKGKSLGIDPSESKNLENAIKLIDRYISKLSQYSNAGDAKGITNTIKSINETTSLLTETNRKATQSIKQFEQAQGEQESALSKAKVKYREICSLLNKMRMNVSDASAAKVDQSAISSYLEIIKKIEALKSKLLSASKSGDASEITTTISRLHLISIAAKQAGESLKRMTSDSKGALKKEAKDAKELENAISSATKKINDLTVMKSRFSETLSKGKSLGIDPSELKNLENVIKSIGHYISKLSQYSNAGDTKGISDTIKSINERTSLLTEANRKAAQSVKRLEQAQGGLGAQNRTVASSYDGIISKMNDLGKKTNWVSSVFSDARAQFAMSFMSVYGLKGIIDNVIQVGGEFERQHVALQTILGDAREANALFGESKNKALESPFTFKDLATYAKQLAAFSIPYEELFDTTNKLSDISAGLGVDMSRLILAYGQVRSATVLRGQELRQFTEAGVPMVKKLADYFTKLNGTMVDTKDIFKMISNKEVPFEAVKSVMFDMTEEGGEFYDMQSKIADTLSGRFSNLHDAMQIFLGDIADTKTLFGSTLKMIIEGLTSIIRNVGPITAMIGGIGFAKLAKSISKSTNLTASYGLKRDNFDFGTGYQKAKALEIAEAQNRIMSLERQRLITNGELTEEQKAQLAVDKALISTKGRMQKEDYIALATSGKLNKYQMARLVAEGKINKKYATQLLIQQGLSEAEARRVFQMGTMERNLRSIGSKISGVFSSIFTIPNAVSAGIFAVGAVITSIIEKRQELLRMSKEMSESLSSSSSDINKFLDNNNVNVGDDTLAKAIDKYKEELGTASGNSNVIISRLEVEYPEASREKLEAYRKELERIAEAKEMASRNTTLPLNAMEDTDHAGLDGGTLIDVLKRQNENMESFKYAFNTKLFSEADYNGFISAMTKAYELTDDETKALYKMKDAGYTTSEMFEKAFYTMPKVRVIRKHSYFGAASVFLRSAFADSDRIKEKAGEYADTIARYYGEKLKDPKYKEVIKASIDDMLASDSTLNIEQKGATKTILYQALGLGYTDELMSMVTSKFKSIYGDLYDEYRKAAEEGDISKDLEQRMENGLASAAKSIGMWMPYLKDTLGNMFEDQNIYKKLYIQMRFANAELQDWQKAMLNALDANGDGNITETIKASTDPADAIEKLKQLYSTLNSKASTLSPILLGVGFNFQTPNPNDYKGNPLSESIATLISGTTKSLNILKNNTLGVDFTASDKDSGNKGGNKGGRSGGRSGGGSKKDVELERAKKNFELYKKFVTEYERWADMVGKKAALERLKNDGEFKSIFSMLTDPADFDKSVNQLMGKFKGSENADRRSAYDESLAEKARRKRKQEEDSLKSVNDELKRNLDLLNSQYEMYEKMYTITGDENASASFAKILNGTTDVEDGIRKRMQQYLDKNFNGKTVDDIMKMSEEEFNDGENGYGKNSTLGVYRKQLIEETTNSLKKANDALLQGLSTHMSIDEQIAEENNKLELQKRLISESEGTPEQKANATDRVTRETADKKSQLHYKQSIEDKSVSDLIGSLSTLADSTVKELINFLKSEYGKGNKKYQSKELEKIFADLLKAEEEMRTRDLFGNLSGFFGDASFNSKRESLQNWLIGLDIKDPDKKIAISQFQAEKYGIKQGDYTYGELLGLGGQRSSKMDKSLDQLKKGFDAVTDALNPVVDLFDALGVDMEEFKDVLSIPTKALGSASSVGGAFSTLSSLFPENKTGVGALLGKAGPYGAAAAAALSVATSIFALHDKALQKEIEASEQRQKEMENLSKNLETTLERTFGGIYKAKASSEMLQRFQSEIVFDTEAKKMMDMYGVNFSRISKETSKAILEALSTGDYYDASYASLLLQREELERQRQLEEDKKKTDDSKISDYNQQITELTDKIEYFAEDMAKSLYDIDVKNWAQELTDVLVDAWANGEDAALAYKNKVTDIMNSLAKNVISKTIMETLLSPVNKAIVEMMNETNGKLTQDSISKIADMIMDESGKAVDNVYAILEELKKKGLDLSDTSNNSTIGKGIQSVTEDTADLLASYINAIRADVSANRQYLTQIVEDGLTGVNASLVLQITELRNLSSLTERNARATEEVRDMLDSVITIGSGGKKIRV